MSFYDLCKNSVLSAKDLFKYRVKRDVTIPAKGGQKDYEPDGSWMQAKALEVFMQERSTILSEPRVEKLKSLVQGEWDSSKNLVTISKPGKFWAHMGFTDNRRNWLFPEEALFLMEANALEVYDCSIPLSIQEAYTKFLGSDVSIEEYQVFSHLRRLGFVVQRHDEHPSVTPYEKKINLDKYLKKRHQAEKKCKTRLKDNQLKTSSEAESHLNDRSSLIAVVDLNTADTSMDSKTNGKSSCSKSNDEKNASSNTDDVNIINNKNGQLLQPLEKICTTHSPVCESQVSADKNNSNAQVPCPVEMTDTTERLQISSSDQLESDNDMMPVENHSAPPHPSVNIITAAPSGVEKRNISQVDSVEDDILSKKPRRIATEVSDSKDLMEDIMEDPCSQDITAESMEDSIEDPCNQDITAESMEDSIEDPCSQDISAESTKMCRKFYHDSWLDCRLKLNSLNMGQSLEKNSTDQIESCEKNYSETTVVEDLNKLDNCLSDSLISLPDIANTEVVKLVCPDQKFIPPNIEISADDEALIFNVNQYKSKNQKNSKKRQKEEEKDACLRTLQFSFPKWIPGHPESSQGSSKKTFLNWSTYKKKLAEVSKEQKSSVPVAHYWEGDVTPLVHPSDATSYEAILSRLSIIQTADNETLTPDSDCMISIKISYDVHLPDSRFKKSMPGVPHHRVCVTKSSTEPPGLAEFQELWSRFKDDVPIHWAVVDSGEISFFVFNNTHKLEVWK